MLHRFRAGRGTETVALEAKLLQQLTAMREAVLFDVFLDLHKSSYALYWYRCLDIFVACGVVPRTLRLLCTYWYRLNMVARSGGYFGLLFKDYRGVTQVDPLSHTLFNMVMYAGIRH